MSTITEIATVLGICLSLVSVGVAQEPEVQEKSRPAVEFPVAEVQIPKPVLAAARLSAQQELTATFSFYDPDLKCWNWILYVHPKSKSRLEEGKFILVGRSAGKGKPDGYFRGKVIDNARLGVEPHLHVYRFNVRKKKGLVIVASPDIVLAYVLLHGLNSKTVQSQGFIDQPDCVGVADFFFDAIDEDGVLAMTERHGLISDFGVQYSPEKTVWRWNGKEWRDPRHK
jgi:hypothetical protein